MSEDSRKYGAKLHFGWGSNGIHLGGTISSREELDTVVGVLQAIAPLVFPESEAPDDWALNSEAVTQNDTSAKSEEA